MNNENARMRLFPILMQLKDILCDESIKFTADEREQIQNAWTILENVLGHDLGLEYEKEYILKLLDDLEKLREQARAELEQKKRKSKRDKKKKKIIDMLSDLESDFKKMRSAIKSIYDGLIEIQEMLAIREEYIYNKLLQEKNITKKEIGDYVSSRMSIVNGEEYVKNIVYGNTKITSNKPEVQEAWNYMLEAFLIKSGTEETDAMTYFVNEGNRMIRKIISEHKIEHVEDIEPRLEELRKKYNNL